MSENIYSKLGLQKGNGSLEAVYNDAGKAAYNAHVVAKGEYDAPKWEQLVWAEQYAWCESARAARAI